MIAITIEEEIARGRATQELQSARRFVKHYREEPTNIYYVISLGEYLGRAKAFVVKFPQSHHQVWKMALSISKSVGKIQYGVRAW